MKSKALLFVVTLATLAVWQASSLIAANSSSIDEVSVLDLANEPAVKRPAPATIPAAIVKRIEAKAAKSHPDNYSTQLYLIEREKEAYLELQTLSPPQGVPKTVFKQVSADAKKSHPDNYSTQRYVIGNQLDAYLYLKSYTPPRGIPSAAFKGIVRKAAKYHRTNYSTLKYVIENQVDAYLKMHGK